MTTSITRIAIGIVAACLAALPLAASAQEKGDYEVERGGYVGLGGVAALENFDSGFLEFEGGEGFHVLVGGRVHEHAAVEFDFRYLTGFEADTFFTHTEVDLWALSGNLKGIVLPGRVEPYGIVGMGVLQAWTDIETPFGDNEGTDTGFLVRFGGGVDIHLTRRFTLNLEGTFEAPTGEVGGLQHGLVGGSLRYRF